MKYEIILAPEAVRDFRNLPAFRRSLVRDALEEHLRYEPEKVSRSRIKKLRGLRRPQYRLRIDDIRVFYDIMEGRVEVLAIILKSNAAAWLQKEGEKYEKGLTGRS